MPGPWVNRCVTPTQRHTSRPRCMTNWSRMRVSLPALVCLLAVAFDSSLAAQTTDADFKVYTEHPRLLLTARRLRLLKRESERRSPRWEQFQLLMRGRAQMPEPAFAHALFAQVTNEPSFAAQAIEAALRPAATSRQVAIVYDWCQAQLTEAQRSALRTRLERVAKQPPRDIAAARDKAFASLVTGDAASLREVVVNWWRADVATSLVSGARRIAHADLYPLMELFHVIRDNLQIDLRDDILPVFRDLALERVLSYYPATYPAPENDYRIPFFSGNGEPDLNLAALTRTAEMALVAFENNAQEMQFLQGWLLHDRFILRGAFGVPYEFLWANPYQPGLPYEKLPLRYHDTRTGSLLARSSWEEEATWLAWTADIAQTFSEGGVGPLEFPKPAEFGDAILLTRSGDSIRFRVPPDSPRDWFILKMKPSTLWDIEVDDEGMYDARSDRGGILALQFERTANQAVIIHEPRRTAKAR